MGGRIEGAREHRRRDPCSSTAGVIRDRGHAQAAGKGTSTLKSAQPPHAAQGPQLENLRPPLLTTKRTLKPVYMPNICRGKSKEKCSEHLSLRLEKWT